MKKPGKMKHQIYRYCLGILRKIALFIQMGNPSRKAPILILEPEVDEKLDESVAVPGKVCLWRLSNVLCCGLYGGAIINEQNRVYSRFTSFPWGKDLHPILSLPYIGRRYPALEKAIFLITPSAQGNYYHWITDLLPRLLLIRKCRLAADENRWIILHQSAAPYEGDTFDLLGIAAARIIRMSAFRLMGVKDLLIADFVSRGRTFPDWKKQLLDEFKDRVIKSAPSEAFRKVYLLRGKQRKRRLIGEERLVKLLELEGFHIIDPQQLKLEEQIKVLFGAEVVVALHGAALTNIIFCREGTRIIELRSFHQPPEHFAEIAKTCNLRFEHVHIPPEHSHQHKHLANKQNLILTEQSIQLLMSKLHSINEAFSLA